MRRCDFPINWNTYAGNRLASAPEYFAQFPTDLGRAFWNKAPWCMELWTCFDTSAISVPLGGGACHLYEQILTGEVNLKLTWSFWEVTRCFFSFSLCCFFFFYFCFFAVFLSFAYLLLIAPISETIPRRLCWYDLGGWQGVKTQKTISIFRSARAHPRYKLGV